MSTSSTDSVRKASSNNLNRQLGFYSIAAAAAGVSMLALAHPAAAEVVITKKTIPIPDSSSHIPLMISMANNGIDNFDFFLDASAIEGGSLTALGLSGRDDVLASCSFYCKALALPRGAVIGPKTPPYKFFTESALIEGSETSGAGQHRSLRGDWGGNLKDRYLGVSFPIEGETHYGWVRLTVTTNPKLDEPPISATITAYAYETVANKAILAGTAETEGTEGTEAQVPENIQHPTGPSLGMLAAGTDGLPLWRSEAALPSD